MLSVILVEFWRKEANMALFRTAASKLIQPSKVGQILFSKFRVFIDIFSENVTSQSVKFVLVVGNVT